MDQTGSASALASPSQNAQSGTRDGVPTLVSGFAAGGETLGSVTPRFLLLSFVYVTDSDDAPCEEVHHDLTRTPLTTRPGNDRGRGAGCVPQEEPLRGAAR